MSETPTEPVPSEEPDENPNDMTIEAYGTVTPPDEESE